MKRLYSKKIKEVKENVVGYACSSCKNTCLASCNTTCGAGCKGTCNKVCASNCVGGCGGRTYHNKAW